MPIISCCPFKDRSNSLPSPWVELSAEVQMGKNLGYIHYRLSQAFAMVERMHFVAGLANIQSGGVVVIEATVDVAVAEHIVVGVGAEMGVRFAGFEGCTAVVVVEIDA
jgi:hypothetical protein